MSPSTRKWIRGLIAAGVNSAAATITVVIVDPLTFNIQTGYGKLLSVMIVSAILGIALYLKDHALPEDSQ